MVGWSHESCAITPLDVDDPTAIDAWNVTLRDALAAGREHPCGRTDRAARAQVAAHEPGHLLHGFVARRGVEIVGAALIEQEAGEPAEVMVGVRSQARRRGSALRWPTSRSAASPCPASVTAMPAAAGTSVTPREGYLLVRTLAWLDGRPAGYTQILLASDAPQMALQDDTLVDRSCRHAGVARTLKVVNLEHLQSLPQASATQWVQTYCAETNTAILARRAALGFRCVHVMTALEGLPEAAALRRT